MISGERSRREPFPGVPSLVFEGGAFSLQSYPLSWEPRLARDGSCGTFRGSELQLGYRRLAHSAFLSR